MKKFATLLGAALMAGTALYSVSAHAADELTITSWGGSYSESQRKAFYEPFMAAGNKITEAEYNGEIAKIRAMVEANAVTWDVVDVDTQTALAGCAEGTFETIDWAKCLLALDVVSLSPAVIADTLGAILKYQDDIQRIEGSEAKRLLAEIRAETAGV